MCISYPIIGGLGGDCRGDFQYKEMKLSAAQILENVDAFIPAGTQLAYIATDEKNMSFFKPFFARFAAVRFLKDFIVNTCS